MNPNFTDREQRLGLHYPLGCDLISVVPVITGESKTKKDSRVKIEVRIEG